MLYFRAVVHEILLRKMKISKHIYIQTIISIIYIAVIKCHTELQLCCHFFKLSVYLKKIKIRLQKEKEKALTSPVPY